MCRAGEFTCRNTIAASPVDRWLLSCWFATWLCGWSTLSRPRRLSLIRCSLISTDFSLGLLCRGSPCRCASSTGSTVPWRWPRSGRLAIRRVWSRRAGSPVIVNRPEWSSVGTKERAQAGQDALRPRSHTSISDLEKKDFFEKREREREREREKEKDRLGRSTDGKIAKWRISWNKRTYTVCLTRLLHEEIFGWISKSLIIVKQFQEFKLEVEDISRWETLYRHLKRHFSDTIKVDLTSSKRSFRVKWS